MQQDYLKNQHPLNHRIDCVLITVTALTTGTIVTVESFCDSLFLVGVCVCILVVFSGSYMVQFLEFSIRANSGLSDGTW